MNQTSNTKINSDQLLESLVKDLKPVRVLQKSWVAFMGVSFFTLATALAVLRLMSSYRSDLSRLASTPIYLWIEVLSLLSFLAFVFASMRARIPGLSFIRFFYLGVVLFFLEALGLLIGASEQPRFIDESLSSILLLQLKGGTFCSVRILSMAATCAIIVISVLRRGTILSPKGTVLALSLGVLSMSLFVLPFSCQSEDALHLLLSHLFLPAIVLVPVLYFLKYSLFRLKM